MQTQLDSYLGTQDPRSSLSMHTMQQDHLDTKEGNKMTVRILTDIQKHVIVHQYCFVKVPVKDLATDYKVSCRTIQRVLVEMGVAPVRKPRAVPLYSVQPELPITMTEPSFIQKVKEFFKSIFVKKQQQLNV